jgi:hypothetical protein
MSDQSINGQEVQVELWLDGERIYGLVPVSLTEADGVATSVWRVSDATAMARIEGAEIELRTRFADTLGNTQPCVWTGRVRGIGITDRQDKVTVTIEGVRREWGDV